MSKKKIKFDLINNAVDSLNHAVEHLTKPSSIVAGDLKRAIRDIAHVIELLLKERVRRIHPAFIWQDVDKYPSNKAYIINTSKAIQRLFKMSGVSLDKESVKTISACKKIRDSIEHYEFEINLKEAQGIIGRMLSFIFDFSKTHLDLDLEKEFRNDKRWEKLIEIYEFWEAHKKVLEERLAKEGASTLGCPSCAATTFDVAKSTCVLCGHYEEQLQCDYCNDWFWESELEIFEGLDGDEESGVASFSVTICKNCTKEEDEKSKAADAAEALRDAYRGRPI